MSFSARSVALAVIALVAAHPIGDLLQRVAFSVPNGRFISFFRSYSRGALRHCTCRAARPEAAARKSGAGVLRCAHVAGGVDDTLQVGRMPVVDEEGEEIVEAVTYFLAASAFAVIQRACGSEISDFAFPNPALIDRTTSARAW